MHVCPLKPVLRIGPPFTDIHSSRLTCDNAGNKIARRLAEQGCKVAAWNRDGSKTAALSEAGIAVHHSAEDAIASSDILVLMLSDAGAIQDVLRTQDCMYLTLGGSNICNEYMHDGDSIKKCSFAS